MNKNWSLPTRYLILSIIIIFTAVVGWYARAVLQLLLASGLIAYLLNPAVTFLRTRTRLSRGVAVNLVYFFSLALLIAIPATLVPILINELQLVSLDLSNVLDQLRGMLSKPLVIGGLTLPLSGLLPATSVSIEELVRLASQNVLLLLKGTSRGTLSVLLVVVAVYYLLSDWDRVRDWLLRLPPAAYHQDAQRLYQEIKEVWAAYLRGTLALMFFVGVMFTVGWALIGLPGALVLGVLTGLLNILPELGPLIASILAIIVALLEGSTYLPLPNLWFAALVLGLYLLMNNIKTIWIQPRVMGRSVRLHEGVVFVAIIAALFLGGVLGVLIVVPLLASMLVVGRYLRHRLLGEAPFPLNEEELVSSEPEPKKAARRNRSVLKRSGKSSEEE